VSRGGKRTGAGRRSKLSPQARILIGARVKRLLAEPGIVRDNVAIPYSHLELAQAELNAIPAEKRRGYPTKMLRWVRATLDNAGRLVSGKKRGMNEVLKQVAKEAKREWGMRVTAKMVRGCYEEYLKMINDPRG
jgi:hypothetical protein